MAARDRIYRMLLMELLQRNAAALIVVHSSR